MGRMEGMLMLEDGDGVDRAARNIARRGRPHAEQEFVATVAADGGEPLKVGVVYSYSSCISRHIPLAAAPT